MPSYRFYSEKPLIVGDYTLDGEEAHHLMNVMRVRIGEMVEIVDGKGNLASARLLELGKKSAKLHIETIHTDIKPAYSLTLVLGNLRSGHMEYALEKCTEIGVTDFILFAADKSDRKEISDSQLKRYNSIIQAAIKQSGRLYLPTLSTCKSLTAAIDNKQNIVFGDLSSKVADYFPSQSICLVIGPESGFSEKEVGLLQSKGAQGIRFSQNTLRAETCALVASYALLQKLV